MRGVAAHGDDRPVDGPQQLLHDDLDMPLGGTLEENTDTHVQSIHRLISLHFFIELDLGTFPT